MISSFQSVEVLNGVLQVSFDLGIWFSPLQHPLFETKVLRTGQLYLAVKKGHPELKLKKENQIKALQQ